MLRLVVRSVAPTSLRHNIVADENTICWGSILEFAYADSDLILLLLARVFVFFHCVCSRASMLSSSIYLKHITAQNNSYGLHKATKQVRGDQSATMQASIQSRREPASRRAYIYSSQSELKHRNLPGLQRKNLTPRSPWHLRVASLHSPSWTSLSASLAFFSPLCERA